MKTKLATTKKLNLMLSNGLYAISAKVRTGVPLVPIFLTDFAASLRLVLDMEGGKLLPNKYGVELKEADVKMIVGALGQKSEDEKKIEEAGKKVAAAKEAVGKIGEAKAMMPGVSNAAVPGAYVELKF
jgi:hypothetical protein